MRRDAKSRIDRDTFARLVGEAMDQLPEEFAEMAENVVVVVEDEPSPQLLDEMGLDPDEELFGSYQGVPLTERDSAYQELPDRIAIYRGPISRCCPTRDEMIAEIRDTVIHELGHLFGLDDDEMPY